MRVYFFSEEPAALKLDGQYMGTIDLFCHNNKDNKEFF